MTRAPRPSDVVILGAGAAGLFCASEAARRGRSVLLIDHAARIGEKIRISGGGRCNFTNLHAAPSNFLSQNPKFCISALRGYTAQDFIAEVDRAGIPWHEKKLGQLFCDRSAQDIIDMLMNRCRDAGVELHRGISVHGVSRGVDGFVIDTQDGSHAARDLVIATGGKSIPKIGATGFGYELAEKFGLGVIEPRPGLVPLTFAGAIKEMAASLAGVSIEASVRAEPEASFGRVRKKKPSSFTEGFLFTHRGLSGPSILQVSSYWREGAGLAIDLAPGRDLFAELKRARDEAGRIDITTALGRVLPKRLVQELGAASGWTGRLADWSDARLREAASAVHDWRVTPVGSEGYRTAEVTLGGVDTRCLNSQTMEARDVPGLYFIGEVVDVTGWLGGYNFQWAWSSAHAAARALGSA